MGLTSFSALTDGVDDVDRNAYTTASVAPGAGRLAFLIVTNVKSATATLPTVTGWTQVATVLSGTNQKRLTLFRSMGLSAGTHTIDFGGVTQTSCIWQIVQSDEDVDTTGANGANAIVQAVTGVTTTATTLVITLAAFGNAGNATFGAFSVNANVTITAGSGFTQITHDTGTEGSALLSEYRNDNDTSVDATTAANANWLGIAVEIKSATVVFANATIPGLGTPSATLNKTAVLAATIPGVGTPSATLNKTAVLAGTIPGVGTPSATLGLAVVKNLVAWYDAQRITGKVDGDALAQWDDSSSNGNHAVQATAANKPLYKTGIVSGKHVVRFDGTNDFMTVADSATYKVGELTVFAVCKGPSGGGGVQTVVGYPQSAGADNQWRWCLQIQSAGSRRWLNNTNYDEAGMLAAARRFGALTWVTTTNVIRADGSDVLDSADVATITYPNAVGLYIGASAAVLQPMNGDIAEILIYSGTLSDEDKYAVELYLREKYGIREVSSL